MSGPVTTINKKIKFKQVKDITPLELIKQVVENINTQILAIDLELLNSVGDNPSVRLLMLFRFCI